MAAKERPTYEDQRHRFAAALSNRLNALQGDIMSEYEQLAQQERAWQELVARLRAENASLREHLESEILPERQDGDVEPDKRRQGQHGGHDLHKCLTVDMAQVEQPEPSGQIRRPFSTHFSSNTAVSDLHSPPLLHGEASVPYRLHPSNSTIGASQQTHGISSTASDTVATLGSSPPPSTVTLAHMEAHTNSITNKLETLAFKFEDELNFLATRLGLSDMGIHLTERRQRDPTRGRLRQGVSCDALSRSNALRPAHEAAPLIHQKSTQSKLQSYELWPAWSTPQLEKGISDNSSRLVRHLTHFETTLTESETKAFRTTRAVDTPGIETAVAKRRCACTINPNSRRRMVWETLGISTLMFDLITIPLLVFNPPRWMIMEVMSWITLVYWSLDIFASFNVGYHEKNGLLVMNPRLIALNYFKTWLLFDVVITGVDWASNVASTNRVNLGKIIRIIRISRFLRLVRLMKLMRFFDEIRMRIDSEYVALLLELLQYMAFILAANHFIACAWYWIASMSAPEANWVDVHGFTGREISYLYTTSLHWSLTQFTPASMAVQPQNEKERAFAVVVLIFALIIFGSFVSSLTSAMTTLRQLDRKSTGQFWLLRKYMRQHNITRDLALRAIRYLTHSVSRQRKYIEEAQVPILALLSEPLRDNLRRELYAPSITRHPFFEIYRRTSAAVTQHICGNCVHEEHLSRGDVLFHHSSPATHMFFLELGSLIYFHMLEAVEPRCVEVGQYFCEAVLWTPWMHRGEMCAKTECRMVAIDSAKFRETVLRHPGDMALPTKYAETFVDILEQMSVQDDEAVTDLQEGIRPRMEIFETLMREPTGVSLNSTTLSALNDLICGVSMQVQKVLYRTPAEEVDTRNESDNSDLGNF